MSNPNRTVAAARNRKTVLVREDRRWTRTEADALADQWRVGLGDGEIVRVTSFKMGPRNKPMTGFMIRQYEPK